MMQDPVLQGPEGPDPFSEEPGSGPIWLRPALGRWTLALLLGLLAAGVNLLAVPILTEETPIFLFGGVFVLVAFVGLGVGPGILAAVLSIAHTVVGASHPVVGVGALVYILEGMAARFLYRKSRSLPLSVAVFWFTGGWVWDLGVYGAWVGISSGYIALLFVKQLLNGLLNALGAELILGWRARELLGRLTGAHREPEPMEAFAFQRIVLLTMVPLAVLGLFYARAEYEQVLRDVHAENRRIAWDVVTEVDSYLQARRSVLRALARDAGSGAEGESLRNGLDEFRTSFPEFYGVARTDARGVVRAAAPRISARGEPLAEMDIGDRPYFRAVRETGEPTYGQLIMGRMAIRSPGGPEPAVVIAEPIFDREGAFDGAVLASLDPRMLTQRLTVPGLDVGHRVILLDGEGRVIGSEPPVREVGAALSSIVRGPGGEPQEPFPLRNRSSPQTLRYYPPASDTRESRLGLNLIHASYQPVLRSGWGVLVEAPASQLYPRFMPVAGQIVGVVALVLLILWAVVRSLAARFAFPLKAAAGTGRRIAAGELQELPAPHQLMDSRLREARDLGRSLEDMRRALAAKEARTRARERDLEAQLLQAQKMQAVGLLAGGVAHDFNNLLTPVAGYAHLGKAEADSATIQEYFDQIKQASDRARDLVQQLLAFGRKQDLRMEVLDLSEEVMSAEGLLRPLLREDIELEFRVDDGDLQVLADSSQVHQILMNLAVNAQDAMPDGGRLVLEVRPVGQGPEFLTEDELQDRPLVELRVSDTGTGIPDGDISQIFDPFFTTKGPGEGTGLGLATVYGIVRQHGGDIRVESEVDQGTTFRIFFPVADEAQEEATKGVEVPAAEEGSGRILLVEDDEGVRRFASRVLEKAGYTVSAVASGEEAMAVHDRGEPFDVLVTDVILPGANGWQVYEYLASRVPGLRGVFMSGYSDDTLDRAGAPEGTRLLSKPFPPEDLVGAVGDVLGG